MSTTITTTVPGTYNWTVPAGVTSVTVECWGAGGGGDGGLAVTIYAGGGGGGEYAAETLTVTPGDVYAYTVGAGGAGGDSDDTPGGGGDTSFDVTTVVAHGGSAAVLGGGGSGGTGSSATTHHDGGDGADGANPDGGGGGGSGGTGAAGTDATTVDGASAVTGGGPGGDGRAGSDGDGSAPASGPGGGGGGAVGATGTGGAGGDGQVTFTYTVDASITYPVVELLVGDTWTDITRLDNGQPGVYYRDRITISRGRADETSHANPSTCTFTLNNRDGRFSPRNPVSPYYGLIGRNTQVRVWVARAGTQHYRFWGEVSAWPIQWDISGRDVYVPITASGIKRRLEQGNVPLKSAVYRDMTSPTRNAIVGYWPMEDVAGSRTAAAGLPGAQPLRTVLGAAEFASYSDWYGSDALPLMKTAALRAPVPGYTPTGQTSIRFFVDVLEPVSTSYQELIRVSVTGNAPLWILYLADSGALYLVATDPTGSVSIVDSGDLSFGMNGGGPRMITLELTESGGDVDWRLITTDVVNDASAGESASLLTHSDTLSSATVGRVTSVVLGHDGGLGDVAIGHLSVADAIDAYAESGRSLAAWNDENPADRVTRLCGEEGIGVVSVTKGQTGNTTTMGSQHPAALVTLLEDCETTDLGLLYEPRDQHGFAYRTRLSLYSQTAALTLDYAAHQLADSLHPIDDDQRIRNDLTVSRVDGSSYRVVEETGPMSVLDPPDGVGRYDDAPTALSLGSDTQLPSQAGWRLHLGTVDEARYPQISLQLAHPEFTGDASLLAAVLNLEMGDRIVIENPPAWLPPDDIDLLVQGYTEIIDKFQHDVTLNCAAASPWRVEEYDAGRYDTAGSELAADVPAPDAGEEVTVPARITTATKIQNSSATAVSVTLTDAVPAGSTMLVAVAWESGAGSVPTITSCVDTAGNTYTTTPDVSKNAGTTVAVAVLRGTITTALASGDMVTVTISVARTRWAMRVSAYSGLVASPLDKTASNAPGSSASMASGTTATTSASGELRFAAFGLGVGRFPGSAAGWTVDGFVETTAGSADRALVTAWSVAGDPAAESVTVTIASASTYAGVIATYMPVTTSPTSLVVATTSGPVWTSDGDEMPFDVGVGGEQITVTAISGTTSPQTFTVTRSVNGVSKSHSAGTAVSLWSPSIYAL